VGCIPDAGASDSGSGGSALTACDAGVAPSADGATSCGATCCTPAGTVEPATSLDQAYAQVAGRWVDCGQQFQRAGAPADVVGVELVPITVDAGACTTGCGNMFYLVQGTSGVVRGNGFAYQLTYDISPNGAAFQLNMHPAPNSGFGSAFRYSPCPRELEMTSINYGPRALLVPVNE
jgi:hypothetical protein